MSKANKAQTNTTPKAPAAVVAAPQTTPTTPAAKPAVTTTAPKAQVAAPVATPAAQPVKTAVPVTTEMVAKRAFELFEARGGQHGNHEQDWLQAERELGLGKQ